MLVVRLVVLAGRLWPNGECWVGHQPRPSSKGLSNLRKNHKENPRGLKGMTSKGKRKIRQGCFLIEDLAGKQNCSFFTGTLPGTTMDACQVANEKWGELCRRFIQEVGRELDRVGLPRWICGCTEIQPKRYQETGQAWPHIHLVFVSRSDGAWLIKRWKIKEIWYRTVAAVLGLKRSDVPDTAQCDPIKSKGKLAQYLSKYMSKGEKFLSEIRDRTPDVALPRAWVHCTQPLGRLISSSVCALSEKTSAWLFMLARKRDDDFKLWCEIAPTATEASPHDSPIGFYGVLESSLFDRVLDYHTRERNL